MGIGRYAIIASHHWRRWRARRRGRGPAPAYDGDGVQQAGEASAPPDLAPGHARAAPGGRRRLGRVRQPDPDPLRQRGRVPPLSRRGAGREPGAPGLVRRLGPHPVRPGRDRRAIRHDRADLPGDRSAMRAGRPRARRASSSPAAASRRRACGRRPRSPPSRSPTARSPTTRCAMSRKATSSSRSTSILLVLQDGRIFVIDTRAGERPAAASRSPSGSTSTAARTSRCGMTRCWCSATAC